jgi:hypothetical protein
VHLVAKAVVMGAVQQALKPVIARYDE